MPTRLRARFLALVAVPLVAAVAHPGLARAGLWDIDAARAELAAETTQRRTLTDRDDAVMRRIAIKEELAAALVAGRADLAAVAAEFRELNADEPGYLEAIRATTPGASDAERAARNAIDYALPRVADPAARAAVRRRLEADLARMPDAGHPGVR